MTGRQSTFFALALTALAAAAFPIVMALDWYAPKGFAALLGAPAVSAWDAFSGLAFVALIASVAAIAAGAVGGWVARARGEWRLASFLALVAAVIGTVTTILVARRIVAPPGGSSAQEPLVGAYLGFACCAILALSASAAAGLAWREAQG